MAGLSQGSSQERVVRAENHPTPKDSGYDSSVANSLASSATSPDNFSDEPTFSFSEDDLIPSATEWSNGLFNASSSSTEPAFYEKDPDLLYSKTGEDSVEARITVKRTLLVSESREQRQPQAPHSPKIEDSVSEERKDRRMSRSFAALGRRSKSSNRASETAGKTLVENDASERTVEVLPRRHSNRSESANRRKSRPATSHTDDQAGKSGRSFLSRKGSKFAKKTQEPAPQADKAETPSPEKPPTTPVSKSWSSSQISALSKSDRLSSRIPPLTGTILRRAQQRSFNPMGKRTDELWSVFRSLESDYGKFESKSAHLKGTFVRLSLIPFLQTYAFHPSNNDLGAEDLERRVRILSKWWNGLLDVLQSQTGLKLSGFDRPAVMDGISGIMERPEWRQPLSEFSPLAKRSRPTSQKSGSQPSETSEEPEFLVESVYHNTRNLFVHYLFRQMSLVVDKMSLKNVPVSLVTFCGKCCAYAMFFCPGMADILARLWAVPARNVKRGAESFNLTKASVSSQLSEMVVRGFPQCMHALAFTSYRSTVSNLRTKPVLPMGFEKIPWRGSWTDRWSGKESDLFYVFVKHYHILLTGFLREGAIKEEIACAPGYVLLRAQILSNIDSTLRRYEKPGATESMDGSIPSNFDEILQGDGSALGLPPIPPNASRLMKANRLIMLMRSFLSEKSEADLSAQRLFADCICETLQTAAKATSLFDQGACLAICDFLEEALVILSKFEEHNQLASSLDWSFWLAVFVRMARSDNTLTMIRLIAFVYTAWPTITNDARRKKDLCSEFLLDQDVFRSLFSHWCPMVRSYFMRLLAWRVARCDGPPTEVEFEIMEMLHKRLLETWSNFKFYTDEAVKEGLNRPATAPCNPAPGRRLLIIRTDRPVMPSPLVDSPPASGSLSDAPWRSEQADSKQSLNNGNGFSAAQLFEKLSSSLEADAGKKKGGIFRTLSNLRSSENRSPVKDKDKETTTDSPPLESSETPKESSSSDASSRVSLYEERPLITSGSLESQMTLSQRRLKAGREDIDLRSIRVETLAEFRFSIENSDRRLNRLPRDMPLNPPKLPHSAQILLQTLPDFVDDAPPQKPVGTGVSCVRYSGRALAEWTLVVNECQNFFERRRAEGVSASKFVETPIMSPEPFKRF